MDKSQALKCIRQWAGYAISEAETAQEWTVAKQQLKEVTSWIEEHCQRSPEVKPEAQPNIDLKKALTTKEAALALNKSKLTLEKWHTLGYGPKYMKIGANVYYTRESLQQYIASCANGE